MTTIAQTPTPRPIAAPASLWDRLFDPFRLFFRALRRSTPGMIGFAGLCFYAVWIFILPSLIPFDTTVRLDQISALPGSRIVLVTRAADAETYRTLDSLSGATVGVVRETGGVALATPYAERGAFTLDETRWRSGRGVPDALDKLTEGEIDALLLFSGSVTRYGVGDDDAYADLAVANDALGTPHLLGTDTQGRDIFSHIIHGGTSLIMTAVLAGVFSTVIAVILGSLAALLGGVVDTVLTGIANFVLTIPGFPLLVVLAALLTINNALLLALLIAALSWPVLMRAIRAQVLSLRERDYVEAAVALDLGRWHIITREILPNMMSFVAINFIFAITSAMYQQVGLIFLGMASINDYTWGVMLYFGRTRGTLFSPDGASMVIAPIIAIALFQVSMVLFARALEEMFDPRLRSSK